MNTSAGANSTVVLAALLLVHTIGPQTIIVLPALTQGYVEYRGVSESAAGLLSSLETWGISIATLCMMYLVSRVRWRLLMLSALTAMAASNFISMFVTSDAPLFTSRFIAGFGGGVIVSVSYAMISQTERTQRNFGLAIALVLLYGVVAFPLLSMLYSQWGMAGAFGFFTLFTLCGIPFVRILPDRGREVVALDDAVIREKRVEALLSSSIMLIYFVGIVGAWSYFYRFGVQHGLSEETVGYALSISQFAGLAGALTVVFFESRMRASVGAVAGILVGALSTGAVVLSDSFLTFLTICLVFQFAWNMTHPLLLSLLAVFDPSGRIIVYGTAMQFIGIALGPTLAALLVADVGLGWVALLSAAATAISGVFVAAVVRYYQHRHAAVP
jgi:predicted MFS family arabinose efflux permease